MSHKKHKLAEEHRIRYEREQDEIAQARARVAQQNHVPDGFRVARLHTLDEDLATIEDDPRAATMTTPVGFEGHMARSTQEVDDELAPAGSPGAKRDLERKRAVLHPGQLPPDVMAERQERVAPLFASTVAYPPVDATERRRWEAETRDTTTHELLHPKEDHVNADDATVAEMHPGVETSPDGSFRVATLKDGSDLRSREGSGRRSVVEYQVPVREQLSNLITDFPWIKDEDWTTISVRNVRWGRVQKRLEAIELRLCPRCRTIHPLEEFNTTGFCLCRKGKANPYRPPSHNSHRKGVRLPPPVFIDDPVPVEGAGHSERSSADDRKVEREESRGVESAEATAAPSTPEPTPPPTPPWTDSHLTPEVQAALVQDLADEAETGIRKMLDLPPRDRSTEFSMQWRVDGIHAESRRQKYFELLCDLAVNAKLYTRERDDLLDRIERNLKEWQS